MPVPRRKRRNPHPHQTTARRVYSAIGLGLAVGSAGAALGALYHKPSITLGGVVLGVGLAAAHLPWGEIGEEV